MSRGTASVRQLPGTADEDRRTPASAGVPRFALARHVAPMRGGPRPRPFAFNPSAIQRVLIPLKVPVSTTSSGLMVVTTVRKNSSTSASAVMESNMRQRSGCGHSGVGR